MLRRRAAGIPWTAIPAIRACSLDAARALLELATAASDPAAPLALLPRFRAGEAAGTLPCRWCDHRGVCRVEERAMPPAVTAGLDKVVNAREQGT